MPNPRKNIFGFCPYCSGNDYNSDSESNRNPQQKYMKCNSCNNWSIRNLRNGTQYPVRDQDKKEDGPVLEVFS